MASNISSNLPLIQFHNLKGFPDKSVKIETKQFLNASKEVVDVIETFGKIFTPVINDMNGNIKKLTKVYEKDPTKFCHLEDLISLNVYIDNCSGSALLWLKRGLRLICIFFENIFYDEEQSEVLKGHLQDAYNRTLKPYHGWFVQNTVSIIYRWVPSRFQLIGKDRMHDENLKSLAVYLPNMRYHLDRIDAFLKYHNIDYKDKV